MTVQNPEHAKARLFAQAMSRSEPGATRTFRARGSSMYPLIRDGDTIELSKSDPARARLGDILVTDHETQVLCHRLIRKQRRGNTWWYITQGDTLLFEDAPIPADRVLGLVRSLRTPSSTFHDLDSPSGRAAKRLFLMFPLLKRCVTNVCAAVGVQLDAPDTSRSFQRFLQSVYLLCCLPVYAFHQLSRVTHPLR